MRLEPIRSFLAVVEHGSLTQASHALYISQPTLGHHITELERQLDTTLIIRKKGIPKIKLTAAGRAFIPQAEKMLYLFDETKNIVRLSSQESLSISTSISTGTYLLNELFTELINSPPPDCRLSFSMAPSSTIYQRIEQNETDIAILCNTRFSYNAIALPIAYEDFVLICSKESSMSGKLHPKDLDIHNEIFMPWDSNTKIWHDYCFGSSYAPELSCECVLFLPNFLSRKDSWAVVPYSVANAMKPIARICELYEPPSPRTIYFATHREQKEPYCTLVKEKIIAHLNEKEHIALTK